MNDCYIIRLGSDRIKNEVIRIGTVRRPPRGVPKKDFALKNWYDFWLPNLSPSAETMRIGKNIKTAKDWFAFEKKYKSEIGLPDNYRILELLAALSHQTNFAVGCYCEDEARCHPSVLRKLLIEKGAMVG